MIQNRYRRHTREGLGCPKCGTANTLVRSRVRLRERLTHLFSRKKPYRCLKCMARLWVHPRYAPVVVQASDAAAQSGSPHLG